MLDGCTHLAKRVGLMRASAPAQGRGGTNGYESAIALHTAQDDDRLQRLNKKVIAPSSGTAVFSVAKVGLLAFEKYVSGVSTI